MPLKQRNQTNFWEGGRTMYTIKKTKKRGWWMKKDSKIKKEEGNIK